MKKFKIEKKTNPYKINRIKEDFCFSGTGFIYRIKTFPKRLKITIKNAYNRLVYGYDDSDWYEYYRRYLERDKVLFQEFINCGNSCMLISINHKKVGIMTREQTKEFFLELIAIIDHIQDLENTRINYIQDLENINWSDSQKYNYSEKLKQINSELDNYFNIKREYFLDFWD